MRKINKISIISFTIIFLILSGFLFSCSSNNLIVYPNNLKLSVLNKPTTISNREDLTYALEYVCFNHMYDESLEVRIENSYLQSLLNKDGVIDNSKYKEFYYAGQYGDLSHNYKIISSFDEKNKILRLSAIRPSDKYLRVKSDNKTKRTYNHIYLSNKRTGNSRKRKLTDFPFFKDGKKYLEVNDSETLYYAIANDYIPFIKNKSSNSYKILQEAINILNEIIDESYNEKEKYLAIYYYLVSNAEYDYETFESFKEDHTHYRAYFMEGFFFDKLAVCDGLTKSLILLAKLEGIEIYHIADSIKGVGAHAYAYVKLDGNYYISCPTNAMLNQKEDYKINDISYAIFTNDKSRYLWLYNSSEKKEILEKIKKSPRYKVYEQKINIDDEYMDLQIDTTKEMKKYFEYLRKIKKEHNVNVSFDIIVNKNIINNVISEYFSEYVFLYQKQDIDIDNDSYKGYCQILGIIK